MTVSKQSQDGTAVPSFRRTSWLEDLPTTDTAYGLHQTKAKLDLIFD